MRQPVAIPPRPEIKAKLRPGTSWYRMEKSGDDSPAKVWIMDEIGWYGVEAAVFVRELDALDVDEIELHINSPGGSVFDGLAIFNALVAHRANIVVHVDGIAASAASFIAQAGDIRHMNKGSQMMVHDASGLCLGNAEDMRELAVVLDRVSDSIAGIYADAAGGTDAEWRERMRAETWYDAGEAVAAGLADTAPAAKKDTKNKRGDTVNRWDLSAFRYAGREGAPAPHSSDTDVSDSETNSESDSATDPANSAAEVAAPDAVAVADDDSEIRARQTMRVQEYALTFGE